MPTRVRDVHLSEAHMFFSVQKLIMIGRTNRTHRGKRAPRRLGVNSVKCVRYAVLLELNAL